MTTPQIQPKRGIVKQVFSGDSVIIRGAQGAPPPEQQLNFSSIIAPKLARRATENNEVTQDEPFAWDAREFLRKKIVGEEVWFTSKKSPNTTREYGVVYVGKDFASAENITKTLVSEGFVSVRREGVRMTPDIEELCELENAAKATSKGKWGGNLQEHVRDIKWSVENMRTFVDKQDGKPIKAVIEHIRDGSTVRAFLLPDFYHITLMISGIRCNGFKMDANGNPDPNEKLPFADEARHFVEVRLLQRDVEIILESVNNNNFVGTIVHPNGNIAEILLTEGLARCVDWSIVFTNSGADHLRAAERKAKEARLRLWKDWQSNAPPITGKEKEFSGTVVQVINGDALVLKVSKRQVKKIFLSSIQAPKEAARAAGDDRKPAPRPKGFRPLYDIPWMFEAREFLRKKLVDKKVHVVVDYIQEARDNFPGKVYATVTIGRSNVAEALVSKGLATIVRYRQDDDQRSAHYDELLAAEHKAKKSAKGIHSKKDTPVKKVIEIDAAKSKQYLASFKQANRIDATVEFVASGSRLRLYIPAKTCLCTFLLGGIRCPCVARPAVGDTPARVSEPYGDEALLFTKDRCMQKDVQIGIESTDKGGNFIGWLWTDNNNLNKNHLSVALVEEGLAAVHPFAKRSEYYEQLKSAEDSAKLQKLRRWKDFVEEKEQELQRVEDDNAMSLVASKLPELVEKMCTEYAAPGFQQNTKHSNPKKTVAYEEIIVTEVTSEGTFFAQNYQNRLKAENLIAKMREEFQANPPVPGTYSPKRGDTCAVKYKVDDKWYRVKVEKVQGARVHICNIDNGNREMVKSTRLASLPAVYAYQKPFATEYQFACATLPKDPESVEVVLKCLRKGLTAGKLLLNVEYQPAGGLPAATVLTEEKEDIVKNLITDGLIRVEKRRERKLAKQMI